ncbi:Hypothetical protein SRAE_2000221900 [Strongyloides ratti]|uniref:Uncharacterized protein n=1 Tax=Strongyloides ratti TaxID=34506 RepID=A0A090LCR6_STRRB|nr:Hypothetical protein SRAE_2000221900 [Strongyloides ratti]CEF67557.1 Hypothetical protein SRAE_2000221900 [Strongyloides ratti]
MRRNFNLSKNPGAPISLKPTTVLRSIRSNNVRNLSGECQEEARQQLNDFIRQRPKVVDRPIRNNKDSESEDLSLYMNDILNEQYDPGSYNLSQSSKCNNRTIKRKFHPTISYKCNKNKEKLCFDDTSEPQIFVNSNVKRKDRKHTFSQLEDSEALRGEETLYKDGEVSKRNVRFCDCCFKNSKKSVLKNVENKEPFEKFLQDSTHTPSTDDLLCKEVSPVSKMLEKRKIQLNYGSIKLSSQQKEKRKKEWNPEKLGNISRNISEGIPHLIMSSEKPVTYQGELTSLMKKMFTQFKIPQSPFTNLGRTPSDNISAQIKNFINATSPFISDDGKVSKSCLEETLNFNLNESFNSDVLSIDLERELNNISSSENFLNSTSF